MLHSDSDSNTFNSSDYIVPIKPCKCGSFDHRNVKHKTCLLNKDNINKMVIATDTNIINSSLFKNFDDTNLVNGMAHRDTIFQNFNTANTFCNESFNYNNIQMIKYCIYYPIVF